MAIRIKSHWNKKGKQRSPEETGSAIGFAVWRLSGQGLLNLENEGFQTDSMAQRVEVIREFSAFLVHVSDRMAYEKNTYEDRQEVVTALAKKLAEFYHDNMTEAAGPGAYREAYVEFLNQRMGDYADFNFSDGEAGFNMRRYFGDLVTAALGPKDSKWVSDQVMEIEAPEAVKGLKRALRNLVKPSRVVDDGITPEMRAKMPDDV